MKIDADDVACIALGAAVLGTGGGGDPYVGKLALRRQIELRGEPTVVKLQDVPDDWHVVAAGMAGSPTVGLEKLLSVSFADSALREYERIFSRRVDAVVPLEVGGINSLMPLLTGCATGLPVIDADSMGRAFPSLDRTTFGIAGLSPFPVVFCNEQLETVTVAANTALRGEQLTRVALVEMGGAVTSVMYPMTGRQVKAAAIPGTMTLALEIGRALLAARAAKDDPFEAVIGRLRRTEPATFGRVLFDGKVADVSRDTVGGYNVGSGVLESIAPGGGAARFSFQNEFLYLRGDGGLLAVVPDLVCFLDRETAEPVTCETLRYGQRVKVLGFACAPQFRTPAGLAAAGPASFSLSEEYVPVEALAAAP